MRISLSTAISNPLLPGASGIFITFFIISNLSEPIVDEFGNNLVFM